MDDHSISWASVIYTVLGLGGAYLAGAGSVALVLGLLRAIRKGRD